MVCLHPSRGSFSVQCVVLSGEEELLVKSLKVFLYKSLTYFSEALALSFLGSS